MIIFEDNFEKDFAPYTATYVKLPADKIEINMLHPHHGLKNLRALSIGIFEQAYCQKNFAPIPLAFGRAYIEFNQLNLAVGTRVSVLSLQYDTTNWVAASVHNNGGNLTWSLYTSKSGAIVNNLGTHNPVTGTRYCVEIRRDTVTGAQYLWINDVLEASSTTVMSSDTVQVLLGTIYQDGAGINEIFADCLVVSTEKIGMEVADQPTVYEELKTVVQEAKPNIPSRSAGVPNNYGARVRTVSHRTPISPWTAK